MLGEKGRLVISVQFIPKDDEVKVRTHSIVQDVLGMRALIEIPSQIINRFGKILLSI